MGVPRGPHEDLHPGEGWSRAGVCAVLRRSGSIWLRQLQGTVPLRELVLGLVPRLHRGTSPRHPAVRRCACAAASALLRTAALREWTHSLSKAFASDHACSWRDLPLTAGGTDAVDNLDMHGPWSPACHEGYFMN